MMLVAIENRQKIMNMYVKGAIYSQTTTKVTKYRWVVMAILAVFYSLVYADRANIGVALPLIQSEFKLNNFQAGSLASMFFVGYAITQIPAGFWYSKFGVRGLLSFALVITSVFTGLIGTARSAAMSKLYRVGLGLAEGPCPVGVSTTINNWFPPHEKGLANGIYFAAAKFAPVIVPPVGVWIMLTFGWRHVFYFFAIPGLFTSLALYFLIKNQPEDSRFCSQGEIAYIRDTAVTSQAAIAGTERSFGWFDKLMKAKKVRPIDTNREVFLSWNIWANTIGYFLLINIIYGLLTWVPSYLIKAKHFSFIQMGYVAAMPWIGAVVGAVIGGRVSDKLLAKRRKPLILFSTAATIVMMLVLVNVPANKLLISLTLLLTGIFLNVRFPLFVVYPMALTTRKAYPVANGLVSCTGNLGGLFSPMIAGYLLDAFSYNAVFGFFGACSAISLLVVLTMDEPI
jgi:sugar phosphate permease